jgi:curved DNA-binding protein
LYGLLFYLRCSQDDIRKAYKKMSMQHHPDRGGDENQFKRVNEAYSTLKDPHKRAEYDHSQTAGKGGFNFNNQQQHYYNRSPFGNADMFGNIFDDLRQQQAHRQRQQQYKKNKDITIAAKITLEEVLTGKELIANYKLYSGKTETVNIKVPAGAQHGHRIRFQGLGDNTFKQLPRGDLYVKIEIIEDPHWLRDNYDLYCQHPVNALDLITGCVIIVETIDKRQIRLQVPQGSGPNKKFKLPGYGLPNYKTGVRGNAYVVLQPEIPVIDDPGIIRKLKKIRNNIDKN